MRVPVCRLRGRSVTCPLQSFLSDCVNPVSVEDGRAEARRFRVIVPDLRNHGKSDWVRGRVEITDLADDLAGILDTVGIQNATVLGYSMGGMVVQELARRHPRHVGSMILAATASYPISEMRIPTRVAFWLARGGLRVSLHENHPCTVEVHGTGRPR